MKTHLKRIGTFLIYTLGFNIVSFILYFTLAFSSHYFEGIVWVVFGTMQICFTILFFNKIPLYKISNEKGIKKDLLLFFIILCALSIIAEIFRLETDSWFSYVFLNTYFTFSSASIFNTYIGIYIIENALKTYLLYTNISKKTLAKPICIVLGVIMVLAVIATILLLVIFQ